jgi:hypothetical protein
MTYISIYIKLAQHHYFFHFGKSSPTRTAAIKQKQPKRMKNAKLRLKHLTSLL